MAGPDPTVAILLLLGSTVCLGTWPALLELGRGGGRDVAHAFLDYALAYAATAGTFAAAASGSVRALLPPPCVGGAALAAFAIAGGALLMFGNLSLQRALALGGSITALLPLQASLCVVLGTGLNYALQPGKSDAALLFGGVFCFLVAIALNVAAQLAYHHATRSSGSAGGGGGGGDHAAEVEVDMVPLRGSEAEQAMAGVDEAERLGRLQSRSKVRAPRRVPAALAVGFAGGCCFGFFSPAFNIAVNDELGFLGARCGPPLTVSAANLLFALAFAAAAVATHAQPVLSTAQARRRYWQEEGWVGRRRVLSIGAGAVCSVGNLLQFAGGQRAGFAAADLVQSYPVIGIVWGAALFGDYADARREVLWLLGGTYAAYLSAVLLMALSARGGV